MKFKLTATDWQKEVIEEVLYGKCRFFSLMAGRRAGKTFAARTTMIMDCLRKKNRKWWYIAPSYAQAKEQYEGMSTHPAITSKIKKVRQQPYPMISFRNGSSIGFRSFERAQALKGSGMDGCWCDEIQDFRPDLFWPIIRPLLSDRRGKLVISGQHSGINAWYYLQLYLRGLKDNKDYNPLYMSWNIPSWRGMVYLSEEGREE